MEDWTDLSLRKGYASQKDMAVILSGKVIENLDPMSCHTLARLVSTISGKLYNSLRGRWGHYLLH